MAKAFEMKCSGSTHVKGHKIVNWSIDEGCHGLVPCGTTGESPTLNHQEHMRVTEICIEVVKIRVPVMAGCGSNSTDEAISLVSHAQKAGAEADPPVRHQRHKFVPWGVYTLYFKMSIKITIF